MSAASASVLSGEAREFARSAISERTRSTYEVAVRAYQAYCVRLGERPGAAHVSPSIAANWIAELGANDRLNSKTVAGYRSALRTWVEEETLTDALNPFTSVVVLRVLKGVVRAKEAQEIAERVAGRGRKPAAALTPAMLTEARPYLFSGAPGPTTARMMWAASCVGVYGLLRPNEFLGAYRQESRALKAEQITFYAKAGSAAVMSLRPKGTAAHGRPMPDRLSISLGVTKADPHGRNAPIIIAAASAVEALWLWCHERRDMGDSRPELFCMPAPARPLSIRALLDELDRALAGAQLDVAPLTGKCFRRGGNSAILAGGGAPRDAQTAGRWRTPSMVARYADESVLQQRAIEVSRGMDPAAKPKSRA